MKIRRASRPTPRATSSIRRRTRQKTPSARIELQGLKPHPLRCFTAGLKPGPPEEIREIAHRKQVLAWKDDFEIANRFWQRRQVLATKTDFGGRGFSPDVTLRRGKGFSP